jgi:2-succinyl-5-enolpyruvyl-6-hydroxy-3-cyclohexene-1-carboxylate synthase
MKLNDLDHVYFCTGARNNDLLELFNPDKLSFEVDERIASFKALGRSKILGQPIAVCTTSGTAVSECISAFLEAYYSQLPLLLITGDRPKKMHGKACPQTVDHENLTRDIRHSYIEVGLNELMDIDLSKLKYPAHINVLIEKKNEVPQFEAKFYESSWSGFEKFIQENKSPLILVSHENQSMLPFVEKLSQLNIPFYAEILSGAHSLSKIKTEKDLLKAFHRGDFSSIIRIGHTPLTKLWRLLEQKPLPQFSFDERGFLGLSYGAVLTYKSSELFHNKQFWNLLNIDSPQIEYDDSTKDIEDLVRKYPHSDISKIYHLDKMIDEDSIVYLGNSLVIRFFELVRLRQGTFYGNRGVNGIDGQLSTAIGLASATKKNVYCILGDLTTQYDLTAIKDIPGNLKLIIINNQGGRIFETLNLNKKLYLEHHGDFASIANAFNISYALNDLDALNQVNILELLTDPVETMSFLKEWEK